MPARGVQLETVPVLLRRFFLLLLLPVAVMGCQQRGPGALSLDDARRTAAQMSEPGLALPPRSIQDVITVLDAWKPDEQVLAARRAAVDAEPAAGLDRAALADFYF